MGDLFDDFLDELRRRQAQAMGQPPPRPRRVGPDDGPAADGPDGDDRDLDDADVEDADRDDRDADLDDESREEPLPFDRARGAGGGPGGPDGRRPSGPFRPREPNLRRIVLGWVVVLVIVAIVFFGRGLIDLWTDVLWYQTTGYESVFWTRLGATIGLFVAGLAISILVLLGNLWLAGRLARPPADGSGGPLRSWIGRLEEAARSAERTAGGQPPWEVTGRRPQKPVAETIDLPNLVPIGRWVLVALAIFLALGFAGSVANAWDTILLWQNRQPFSPDGTVVADPIFGRDIGFFLFELPFLGLAQALIAGLALTALLLAGARYLLAASGPGLAISTPVRLHLGFLAGIYLLAVAFGYQLDKLELVYSNRGVATGVSYTDANAQFIAFDLLMVISALTAALLVGAAFTRWTRPVVLAVGVWFIASALVGGLYPEVVQRLVVDPNQLAQERPYIVNNIQMTRLSFGFANADGSLAWDESRRYQGDAPLTEAAFDEEGATFRNARLWDYRPLGATLDQLQTIRRYYDFHDVDTDRYVIDGVQRQVMLSARELGRDNPNAVGFVNRRIVYTHGIGVAMVPVNEVTNEGQPRLFVRNLPPVSSNGAPDVTQPRIYFGELTDDWIVVGARQAEFDFPRGDPDPGSEDTGGVETRWTGTTGIRIDSLLTRLLFAVRFGSLDLLISDQVTADSQLLFNRDLGTRVPSIAPFLRYDKDPYVVIDGDGRLVYVWDAFTTSDRFPHANAFNPQELGNESGLAGAPFNYLRNSVKVTIDAYDGTMRFYIADPSDPLIRAWAGVFPELFRSLDELPDHLEAHLRAPEERFNVQTRMYGRYHVTDPQTFFQNEDLWMVPSSPAGSQSLPSEAYYVVMRMPGETEAEFLLLQPMVPINRPNMISWVAARNDPPHLGEVRVYRFPSDTTVFGPVQIEARIDQDPIISSQVTLWDQAGSSVVRGNLIVVPVGESLLYFQPVYLQSTASAFPEFQRIIVASATEVVWAPTLGEALDALIAAQGGEPSPSPTPTPSPEPTEPPGGPTPTPTAAPPGDLPNDIDGLIEYANRHFELAQEALRAGDLGRYAEEMELVGQALARMGELGALDSPAPGPPAP